MSYPKPLSKKTIEKMFASWDKKTVDTLHMYYEAFADLYGMIQLKEAWKIFKQFEPKIHKKQFMEFSDIVRREDVKYYIYEIDELFSMEKRIVGERYIVNKALVSYGYGKFSEIYLLDEEQYDKPYYAKEDLLEVSKNRLYDSELRKYIANMRFTEGENAGKLFSEAIFLTDTEKFDLEYFKGESKRKLIRQKADKPFSEKLMNAIVDYMEFSDNVVSEVIRYLAENGYTFESEEEIQKFVSLIQTFNNKSHLWRNCGHTPEGLFSAHKNPFPPAIGFGPGLQKAFSDGDIEKDELVRYLNDLGIDVVE